jgi:hypothetical protein
MELSLPDLTTTKSMELNSSTSTMETNLPLDHVRIASTQHQLTQELERLPSVKFLLIPQLYRGKSDINIHGEIFSMTLMEP